MLFSKKAVHERKKIFVCLICNSEKTWRKENIQMFFHIHLREDAAKFLQFCGTENFGFQFYDLIWLIIVILGMLAINGGPVCQIGGSTDKKRN